MHDPQTRLTFSLEGRASDRPRAARRWVVSRCAELDPEMEGAELALVASELVTNACVHGAEPISVRLDVADGQVRLEVEDGSSVMPKVQPFDGRSTIGRGLLIVEALSRAWGSERTPAGKVVWAEVPIPHAGSNTTWREPVT